MGLTAIPAAPQSDIPAALAPPLPGSAGEGGSGLDARIVALDALTAVFERRKPLDEVIEENPDARALDPRDRAFARLLIATTLRHWGEIDHLIADALERPLPRHASAARIAIALGVTQLLLLGTKPHAAVNSSVSLVRLAGHPRLSGLANAVLRRLSRGGAAARAALDAPRINTPDWLWQGWCRHYGEDLARAIAASHAVEPPLDLTPKDAAEAATWAARLGAMLLPTGSLRLAPGAHDIAALPGFADGAWWVQDAAAALPAKALLAALPDGGRGCQVVDLCAAPGGKCAQLAAAGAAVIAVDRSGLRLRTLERNALRLGLALAAIDADARNWRPDRLAAAVLLDAPCSATGTIRRHPDVPWQKRRENVRSLLPVQAELFTAASEMVEPGGVLVYSVCSLEPEEGIDQAERFLARHPDWQRQPIRGGEIGGLDALLTPAGDLRSLPCHLAEVGGMDGFYAVRLRAPVSIVKQAPS